MTEDEAKTKWCPFARCAVGKTAADGYAVLEELPSFNRIAHPNGTVTPITAKCIGSACMAWRSFAVGGHCGLAGKPD